MSRKYTYFEILGTSARHQTLVCAKLTAPTLTDARRDARALLADGFLNVKIIHSTRTAYDVPLRKKVRR